jgi:hypothetical protein
MVPSVVGLRVRDAMQLQQGHHILFHPANGRQNRRAVDFDV